MSDIIQILLWPALACLVLTGIHAYLGLHVVERGVIFVDLSLAQVAALGATIAFLCGADLHGSTSYWVSLGFTLIGAAVFAMTRSRKSKIPQEAIIGIVYAVCAAASVLVMDRLPEGAEHIKYILVGNLLAVTPHEVIKMAILYSGIGLLHWIWRKPFLAISTNHAKAFETGYNVRLWDFLFYGTFGFVVTSSVAIAGVLLVFSFLIVPSVAAMFFSDKVGTRLAIGWVMGTAVSFLGMYGSYKLDAPTGATVVCTFGLALLVLAAIRPFVRKRVKLVLVAGLVVLGLESAARADNLTLLAQADAAYAKREDVPQAKIAMITYERAAASDSKIAVEALWKASRAAWWVGDHASTREEKLETFQKGMTLAQRALQLSPDAVAAHYWLGCNEGSYGDEKGVLKSLALVKPIRKEMNEVLRLDERYSNGGAWQVLGVVDYKVPGLMGGSKARAKEELEKALAIGPNDPFNHYYMAEYYQTIGDKEKKEAELVLLRALNVTPDLVPEFKMLLAKAEKELR